MQVQPYLFFEGRCEEAYEFYRRALGAEAVMMMRFRDSPQRDPSLPPGNDDKVLHMTMRIGETTVLASDGYCSGTPNFQGFSLSVSPPDGPAAERIFAALSEGGEVKMPLSQTFFASHFGMLTDRFGLGWMVVVQTGAAPS